MTGRSRLLFAASAVLALALLMVIVIVVARAGRDRSSRAPRTFEIEMRVSAGTTAQIFWAADARFVGERSIQVPLRPTTEGFQRLRFPLPGSGIRWLRYDPTDAAGEILIAGVRLLDADGQVLETFDPRSFRPLNQIASITPQGGLTKVVTAPAATDPSLILAFGRVDHFSLWSDLALVKPSSLALAAVAALALLSACLVVIGRAALGPGNPDASPAVPGPSRWRSALWLTMLFLVVFSAKLLLMRDNPSRAPFWDQWDSEAAVLFVPFNDNSLSWRTMFDFHNEHRVFFSRLLALGLLAMNGQWDPRLEQVANAAMHSLTAVLLSAMFWMAGERRRLDLLVFASAVTFALPFGWENTLIGFQSAFYFLILFSLLALWLTTASRPGTGPWWLGWSCAVCGLFTAAGGVITPAAIAGVAALKFAGDRREWREAVINVGAAAVVMAIGMALASAPLAHHAALKARTLAEFGLALAQDLSWPWLDRPRLSIVMWLPLGALLAAAALRRARTTALERTAVGLGLWVVLNAGAIAYGRGAGAGLPATRYLDFLSLGFVVNVVAILTFLDRTRASTLARNIATGALVGWLVFAMVGVDRLVGRSLTNLTSVWRQFFAAHAANVRGFLITDDLRTFVSKRPLVELPYPDPNRLATLLQDPYIRRIMPAGVRKPLQVEPRVSTNEAFVPDAPATLPRDPLQRVWLSLSGQGRKAQGRFVSQPLTCQLGERLKFEVSGYLGWEHQYLAIKDLRTGRDVEVIPAQLARESWTDVTVPCPPGPFEIVAIDETDGSWFGFREPVEIGWASTIAESLIQHSRGPLVVLLTLAVLGLAIRWT
jgi:hypothetical protein